MENTLNTARRFNSEENSDTALHHNVVAAKILCENDFAANREFIDLSFQQAIYDFPKERIAIIDEDGQIIAANNCWLNAYRSSSNCTDYPPELGLSYFDFLRFSLPHRDALTSIANLKRVIRGDASHFFAHAQNLEDQISEIVAYPLNDVANTLLLNHRLYPNL